jgi:hypothetical protein
MGVGRVRDGDGGAALDVRENVFLQSRCFSLMTMREECPGWRNLELGNGDLDFTLSFNDLT